MRTHCIRNWVCPIKLPTHFQLTHRKAATIFRFQLLCQILQQIRTVVGTFLTLLLLLLDALTYLPKSTFSERNASLLANCSASVVLFDVSQYICTRLKSTLRTAFCLAVLMISLTSLYRLLMSCISFISAKVVIIRQIGTWSMNFFELAF